jgi:hypothetical protein
MADAFVIRRGTARTMSCAAPTLLRIEASQTALERDALVHTMNFGAESIARLFRHELPAPREIEHAIDVVEEELMRVPPVLRGPGELASDDAGLRAWAATGADSLALDAVEALFQRLASAALGQPAAMHGLRRGRDAAATLLIVREMMHHLGYPAVIVRRGAAG